MRSTGIEYSSTEATPVMLPEMAQLLPPLTGEQLAALERDLLANGCYSPIIVNEDMAIIDGHNRYELCAKHGIPYKMAVFSFTDMLEAKQWALDTQKGRRNLDKWELGKIALKLREDVEARARANQSAAGGDKFSEKPLSATLPEAVSAVDTRKELAEAVGIGERTMGKVMQIDEHAPALIREALDNGELSINQGYNLTRQLQDVPEDQRDEAAAQAVELAKAKKEIQQLDAEAERRGRIAGLFCKAFERAVLLTPTEENVRLWVEGTRMRTDEIEDSMKDARNLSGVFSTIADILERMLPIEVDAEGGCT